MIYIVIILGVFLSISIYANIRALKNIELLEVETETSDDELNKIRLLVIDMKNSLHDIDHRGSFEADDEVGFFFKQLQTIVVRLSEHLNIENKDSI